MKNLNPSQIEEIKKLANNNISQVNIAKKLDITVYQVRKALGKFNPKNNQNLVPNEVESQIITLYKQGKTQKEIAELFNTYNTSIRRILQKFGISIRSNSKINRLCKHNPFKNNDAYSDYFLGLLLTDGTITKTKSSTRNYNIILALNEQDGYMVERFRDWASPKSKISKIKQKLNNSYMWAISFSNEEAESWLRRSGNFYRKSYECKVYKKLNWNILRGIFDGDGGFHRNGKHLDFFICGASEVFIKQIFNFLDKEGFDPHLRTVIKNNKPFYYVEIYKIEDVIKLGKLMYKDTDIYLNRKYQKWLSFYESKN